MRWRMRMRSVDRAGREVRRRAVGDLEAGDGDGDGDGDGEREGCLRMAFLWIELQCVRR